MAPGLTGPFPGSTTEECILYNFVTLDQIPFEQMNHNLSVNEFKAANSFSSAEPPFVDSHITCGRDFIQLDVKFNPQIWERVQSKLEMHLIDKYCKPFYVNSTHASIRTPLYDCGTNLEVTKDHMIFSNSFMMSEEPEVGQLVSFIPDVEVKFRCTYGRKNNTRRIGKVAPLKLKNILLHLILK